MKTQLLKKLFASLAILIEMFFFSSAIAQIIYRDVIPDTVISCTSQCTGFSLCTETYNIDINQDGQDDFRLTTYSGPHGMFSACHANVNVLDLSGNKVACDNTNQALAIDANSEIF